MLPIEIESRCEDIQKVIAKLGAELVEMTYRRLGGRGILTLIVDKDGGVTLDDCAAINRSLGNYFDAIAAQSGDAGSVGSFFDRPYFLEVNSPGLDRPLKNAKDFARAIGETLRITVKDASGKTTFYLAEVLAVKEGFVELRPLKKTESIFVSFENIVKAVREIR